MRKRGKEKNQNQSTLFPELEQVKLAEDITMASKECLATTSLEHTKTLAESGQVGDRLELYPGNWLYNAGVVGLLQVLCHCGFEEDKYKKVIRFEEDGSVKINRDILEKALKLYSCNNDFLKSDDKEDISSTLIYRHIPCWHYWYVLESYESFGKEEYKKNRGEENSRKKKKEGEKAKFVYKGVSVDYRKDDIDGLEEILRQKYCNGNLLEPECCDRFIEFVKKYLSISGNLFMDVYRNYYPPKQKSNLSKFIEYIKTSDSDKKHSGDKNEKNENKNEKYHVIFRKHSHPNNSECSFCGAKEYELEPINIKFMKLLMPSYGEFPNSYWNCSEEGLDKICSLCRFIIIHQHIAFTRLGDGSQIFINAPSFELMYRLNNLVKKLYSGKQKSKEVRKILGLTLIEHSRRLWINFGKWSQMNIEVVVRKGKAIDFYSPPYHIVRLLSDRDIAKLIHSAGDNKVLEYILNGEYEKILEGTYRKIREYLREKNRRQNNTSEDSRDREEKIDISKLDKKLKLYLAIKERSHG